MYILTGLLVIRRFLSKGGTMYTMEEVAEYREVRPYNRAKEAHDRLFLDDLKEVEKIELSYFREERLGK
jgi:hypothetical protein